MGALTTSHRYFWPGTHASVPATRDTDFDDRMLKGDGTAGTDGGASTHTHTTTGHGHTASSHVHSITADVSSSLTATKMIGVSPIINAVLAEATVTQQAVYSTDAQFDVLDDFVRHDDTGTATFSQGTGATGTWADVTTTAPKFTYIKNNANRRDF